MHTPVNSQAHTYTCTHVHYIQVQTLKEQTNKQQQQPDNKPKTKTKNLGVVTTIILNTALSSSLPKITHSFHIYAAILLYPWGAGSRTSEDAKICDAQVPILACGLYAHFLTL